jgi:N-acetylneuraminic acid mutarotase
MRKLHLIVVLTLIYFPCILSAQVTQSSQWTWMKGDNAIDQAGVYGTQGTASASNKPGGRSNSTSWTDLSGNFWMFGGYVNIPSFDYLNDLWKYDPSTNQWTWIKGDNVISQAGVYGTQGVAAPTNKPGARGYSQRWTDATGSFWLFGGLGYAPSYGMLNDLWKYDPSTNQWTWVKGDNTTDHTGVYGTKGVSSPTNKPGGRLEGVTWVDASGNFWLFGGYGWASSGYMYLNDLWKYNPTTNEWTWVNGDNIPNQLAIYGTKGVPSSANKPGGRLSNTSWIDASGNLWLFGGSGYVASGSLGYLNDIWKYDPLSNQWTWVGGDNTINPATVYGTQGITSPTNKLGARWGSASWKDASGNVWMFGGTDVDGGSNSFNDLWKYDPLINEWTWIKGDNTPHYGVYGTMGIADPANKPGSRDAFLLSSWQDASGNLWLFGGYGYAASGAGGVLNDLWKLTAAPLPVTLTSVKAYQQNTGINVEWTFAQEIDMDRYEVEKSITGANFSKGGTVVSSGNHSNTFTYSWFDANPTHEANFYRIKMIGKDGKESYSQIVKVIIGRGSSISIYPNPVINNSFALQFNDEPKGSYDIKIINSAGQVVYKSVINYNGGSGTQTIQLPMLLAKGVYCLEVVDPNNKKNVERLVVGK